LWDSEFSLSCWEKVRVRPVDGKNQELFLEGEWESSSQQSLIPNPSPNGRREKTQIGISEDNKWRLMKQ
jgi:hypothetical protein